VGYLCGWCGRWNGPEPSKQSEVKLEDIETVEKSKGSEDGGEEVVVAKEKKPVERYEESNEIEIEREKGEKPQE
jgi:hypothetical protein